MSIAMSFLTVLTLWFLAFALALGLHEITGWAWGVAVDVARWLRKARRRDRRET